MIHRSVMIPPRMCTPTHTPTDTIPPRMLGVPILHRASNSTTMPVAGPPSPARIIAAVDRIGRHFALAHDAMREVLGGDSVAAHALAQRVGALRASVRIEPFNSRALVHLALPEVIIAAVRLRTFVERISAACESIEVENPDAAALRPHLAAIAGECDLIERAEVARAA